MARTLLARAVFKSLSLTLDGSSFGLVYETAGGTNAADPQQLGDDLASWFISTPLSASGPITQYLGQSIDRSSNSASIEVFDITGHLNGSAHGSALHISPFTPTAGATSAAFPEGIAAVLSFRANYLTDPEFGSGTRPRARDRGRIYFGPLDASVIHKEPTTNRAQFSSAFLTDLQHYMESLVSFTLPTSGNTYSWMVWSRKNAATKTVTQGWLDDRPDYQRRRVDPSGVRTSFSIP